MATLPVKKISLGLDPATNIYAGVSCQIVADMAAMAAGGDNFVIGNARRTFIIASNTSGAAIYLKIASGKECDEGHVHDIGSGTITAGIAIPPTTGLVLIGPFSRDEVAGAGGVVSITYTGALTAATRIAVCELAEDGR
jgi:hypothetical protein